MGLHEVHSHHVLHRDLKTNNIFVSDDNTPKIGDFGISKVLEHTTNKASTAVGTPYYLSPEVCKGQRYSWKSDIWALGVILYELCTFNHPFEGNNLMCLVFQICANDIPKIPSEFHPDMASLVKNLLNKEADNRPTTEEIFRIPIVEKYMNNMRKRANRQINQQNTQIQQNTQPIQEEMNNILAPPPLRPLQQFSPNSTNNNNNNTATRRIFETSSDNPLSMKTTQIRRQQQQSNLPQRPQSQANSVRPFGTSQNFNKSTTLMKTQQQQQQQTRIIYPSSQQPQQQQQTVILHNIPSQSSSNTLNESKIPRYEDRPITAKGKYVFPEEEEVEHPIESKNDYPPTRATPIGVSPRDNRPITSKGSYPYEKKPSNSKLPIIKPVSTTTPPISKSPKTNNTANTGIDSQEEYYRLHPEERPLTGHGSYFPPKGMIYNNGYADDEYDDEDMEVIVEAELATSSTKLPVNATLVSPPKPVMKQPVKQPIKQAFKEPVKPIKRTEVVIEEKKDDDDFPSDFEDDFDAPEDVKATIDSAQDSRDTGAPPPSEEVRQVDRRVELQEDLGEILYQSMYDYFSKNDKVSIPDIQLKFGKAHIDKAQLIQMIVLKDKLKNQ